ncbi:MAG: alpha/beta fold hydrolase [Janthinobacterium lividum]
MPSRHQIVSGQAALSVHAMGAGDPVVFLHAGVADSRMWRAQLQGASASHQAIAYDRRGFGATRAGTDAFSAVADLMAVIHATTNGKPAVLVGCSEGGRIALDAALLHPSSFRALALISPSVSGAPAPDYPPAIGELMTHMAVAREAGNPDEVVAIRTRLFLDGPLATAPRVQGEARALFADMNATALRQTPIGANLDAVAAYQRLAEISMPVLVLCGNLDLPNVQARSRHVAATVMHGCSEMLDGAAHLPSLERPDDLTARLIRFLENSR